MLGERELYRPAPWAAWRCAVRTSSPDLVRFEEAAVESPSQVVVLDEEEFRVDLTDIAAQIEAADTLVREREVRTTFSGVPARPTAA